MNPDDYSEMICSGCTSKLSFLPAYKHLIGKNLIVLIFKIKNICLLLTYKYKL